MPKPNDPPSRWLLAILVLSSLVVGYGLVKLADGLLP